MQKCTYAPPTHTHIYMHPTHLALQSTHTPWQAITCGSCSVAIFVNAVAHNNFHFSLCHQKHLWLHLPKCVCVCVCMRVKACEIIKCEVQLFSLWQSENCVWKQIYFESRYFICATLTSSRQQLWLVVILLNYYTFAYEKVDFTRLIERDGVAKIM